MRKTGSYRERIMRKQKGKRFHSFRSKLLMLCIALTVIPTCLISTFQYYYSSKLVERQSNEYLQDVVDWTYRKAEDFINEIEDITFSMISNTNLQSLLSQLDQEQERFEKYKKAKELREQLSSYALLKDYISNISIVTDGGESYSYNKNRSTSDLTVDKEEVYREDGRIVWGSTNQDQQELVIARKINSLKSTNTLGYVAVTVQEGYVSQLIQSFSEIEGGRTYLLDRENRVVSTEDKELLGTVLSYGELDQKEYYYVSSEMKNGWKVVASISAGYFKDNVRNLRNVFYLIVLISALAVAAAAIQLSRSVTKPLVSLSKRMEKFGQGDFEVRYDIQSNDEFGMLADTFNQMVVKIQELLNEVYEQQIMKQKAQMESLQMQINPHFLYNTLDTVNWMARMRGVDEVGEIAAALGNLMRFALRPDTYITLEQEVESLKDYIHIQEYRYGDRLAAQIQIPEDLYGYSIPKLVIQPILENAIVHGVEDKVGDAQVTVTGEKKGDILFIRVKDNGVGMSEEVIERIFGSGESPQKGKGTSIGLCNVHKRLKMHYGEAFGIQIFSEIGKGTEVVLKLKAILHCELTKEQNKKNELLVKEQQ